MAAGLLCLALQAQGTPVQSKFEPTLRVEQGHTLVLNGAGTRYRTIIRVYDLAMYLPRKSGSRDEVLGMTGSKRLEFTALRDIETGSLGSSLIRGMRENSGSKEVARHLVEMGQLVEVASGRSVIRSGERFALEFVPGKGAVFSISGVPQGKPVGDAEFFRMILSIWLGDSAIEPLLRDALLGL